MNALHREGGVVNLQAIQNVDEGGSFHVYVNLICSGSTLGCPLTVNLNITGDTKTGEC